MPARKRARGAIALLLAALLLLGSVPPVFADTDLDLGGTAIVANTGGDAILLRTGAGYDFYVLSHVPPGTAVTVLDGPVYGDEGNPWYKVDVNGSTGYLFAAFLVRPEVAPAAPVVKAAATQGGGDTLAAIAKYGITSQVGYISTGGGAFLEVLEGKTLPAFDILQRRAKMQP